MHSPRILLVDDDKDMLECLEIAFADDFTVTTAAGGAEALRLLNAESFDAVVLDLMMPEVDGIAVLSALRAQGIDVPVLLASAMPDLEATARAFGAAAWLNKPYSLHALAERIRRLTAPRTSPRAQHEERVEAADA